MNGFTYVDSYKFDVNVQKLERDEVYHAYFKSQEGQMSLDFLENEIYSTFNV